MCSHALGWSSQQRQYPHTVMPRCGWQPAARSLELVSQSGDDDIHTSSHTWSCCSLCPWTLLRSGWDAHTCILFSSCSDMPRSQGACTQPAPQARQNPTSPQKASPNLPPVSPHAPRDSCLLASHHRWLRPLLNLETWNPPMGAVWRWGLESLADVMVLRLILSNCSFSCGWTGWSLLFGVQLPDSLYKPCCGHP